MEHTILQILPMFFSGVKVFVFCLYASLCLLGNQGAIVLPKDVVVPAFLAFGDSFVDQGNNNYDITSLVKANYPPYGKDYPGGLPTGRFSNGKTLADVFANALGVKEYVPAYLDPFLQVKDLVTGVSFASGGSGYDLHTSKETTALSLVTQLEMFKEYMIKLKMNIGENATKNIITNSGFLLVAGSYDMKISYFESHIRRREYDIRGYAKLLVTFASSFVQELHKLGARKVAVFSAPPLGCIPKERTLSGGPRRKCADNLNTAFRLYNNMLKQELQQLQSGFHESRVAYVDFYNPLLSIIKNPHKYGMEVVDKGCCGTGVMKEFYLCNKLSPTCNETSKFLFWDGFHLTETGYNIIVDHMISDLVNRLF